MKRLLIIVTLLLSVAVLQKICAQRSLEENIIVRSALDDMFAELDKTKVPSKFLLDYSVDIADLAQYNGKELTDTNFVTLSSYKDILRSLKSAYVGKNQLFGRLNEFLENTFFPKISNSVNLFVTPFYYNVIKANAIEDKLIVYDERTNKVYDSYVDTLWQNPYETAFLFAFTPSSNMSIKSNVLYKIDMTHLPSNMSVRALQFDAGDGLGYRNVNLNSSVVVQYPSRGTKELKMRMQTVTGDILVAHSVMHILGRETSSSQLLSASGTASAATSKELPVFTTSYNGVEVSALVKYRCASGRSVIKKPLIFVEGFDPWELQYALKGEDIDESFAVNPGFNTLNSVYDDFALDSSLDDEYDFIYVDWNNATEDIRANAQLLREIIKEINRMKAVAGSVEGNVVVGHSMGGLVARYALRTMEMQGISHETTTYVSYDSPHLGANIPLGALFFIPELLKMIHGYSSSVNVEDLFLDGKLSAGEKAIYNTLHSPAVQQMLANYVNTEGQLSNGVHEQWQDELLTLGFPNGDNGSGMERLAIVNGGIHDETQLYYTNSSDNYILYSNGFLKSSFLTDIVGFFGNIFLGFLPGVLVCSLDLDFLNSALWCLGSTTVKFKAEVFPFKSQGQNPYLTKLKLWYIKKFLWLFSKSYSIYDYTQPTPSADLQYDDYPGSTYLIDFKDKSISGNNVWGQYEFELGLADKISFIPTASALCINNGRSVTSSYYVRDYYLNPPIPKVDCPFDAYFLQSYAKSHMSYDGVWRWMEQQLNMSISGPDRVVTEGSYVLNGFSGNVKWTTSNSTVAVIDNTGKLTATGSGNVTIIADSYMNGQLYRKTKEVIVNFPNVVISARFTPGEGYRFTANTTDDKANALLSELVTGGILQYQWTIVDQECARTTYTTSENSITFLPKNNEQIMVCVRLIDTDGNKGQCKYMHFNTRDPFAVNYRYVVVNSNGTVYFVRSDDTYDVSHLKEPFKLSFMYNIYNPEDASSLSLLSKYVKGSVCSISYVSPELINPSTYWMTGTKNPLKAEWSFTFFDSMVFLRCLNEATRYHPNNERTMSVFNMTIYNSEEEAMQRVPFAIIYKPDFPSVE